MAWAFPASPRWLWLFAVRPGRRRHEDVAIADAAVLASLAEMFERRAEELVRLARFFVDDRNAAEDLVQEAFIRLARSLDRIREPERADAYLRSIVLNLARDHNRRGLLSLRHQLPAHELSGTVEEDLLERDEQRRVMAALRSLPRRQRDCVTLRYYSELGIPDIAMTLGLSPNSVKTHLSRGLDRLGDLLGERAQS